MWVRLGNSQKTTGLPGKDLASKGNDALEGNSATLTYWNLDWLFGGSVSTRFLAMLLITTGRQIRCPWKPWTINGGFPKMGGPFGGL